MKKTVPGQHLPRRILQRLVHWWAMVLRFAAVALLAAVATWVVGSQCDPYATCQASLWLQLALVAGMTSVVVLRLGARQG